MIQPGREEPNGMAPQRQYLMLTTHGALSSKCFTTTHPFYNAGSQKGGWATETGSSFAPIPQLVSTRRLGPVPARCSACSPAPAASRCHGSHGQSPGSCISSLASECVSAKWTGQRGMAGVGCFLFVCFDLHSFLLIQFKNDFLPPLC